MNFSWAKCHAWDNRYGQVENFNWVQDRSYILDVVHSEWAFYEQNYLCNNSYTPPYIFISISQNPMIKSWLTDMYTIPKTLFLRSGSSGKIFWYFFPAPGTELNIVPVLSHIYINKSLQKSVCAISLALQRRTFGLTEGKRLPKSYR